MKKTATTIILAAIVSIFTMQSTATFAKDRGERGGDHKRGGEQAENKSADHDQKDGDSREERQKRKKKHEEREEKREERREDRRKDRREDRREDRKDDRKEDKKPDQPSEQPDKK